MKNSLTQKELKQQLDYNELTGIFIWKSSNSTRTTPGDIAGCKASDGGIVIGVNGERYKAHRLAWLYVHGYFPESFLDHKDRIRDHNWISNLREASNSCNQRNTGSRKNNTSGVKGVVFRPTRNKWGVDICSNGRRPFIGYYEDFDEAVCHRLAAEQCLDWSGCDDNSPAYKHVQKMMKREFA